MLVDTRPISPTMYSSQSGYHITAVNLGTGISQEVLNSMCWHIYIYFCNSVYSVGQMCLIEGPHKLVCIYLFIFDFYFKSLARYLLYIYILHSRLTELGNM